MGKVVLKIVLWTLGILIGLFLVIWILLQIPAVQNTIIDKVTASLSRTLKTEVSIDRVNIRFIKTLVLEGIYVESRQQDTLLYARKFGVNIGLFDLFDNRIHVNNVALDGAVIKVYRAEADSAFNYQFILDAFDTKDPDTTATQTVWTFGVDKVTISDSRFRMLDEFGRSDLDVAIGDFETRIGKLDLENPTLDIDLLRLENSSVAYRILESNAPPLLPEPDTTLITEPGAAAFPNIGWALILNRLRLKNNAIIYDNANELPIVNAVDFNHLDVRNLDITADNFLWRDSLIQGNIERIALRESSGFTVNRLGAALDFNTRQLAVRNLIFQTPQSNFQANTTLTYNSFADFVNDFNKNVRFDLNINNSYLAFEDLEYFAPAIAEIRQLNTELNKTIRLSARAQGTFTNLNNFVARLYIENGIDFRAEGSASNLTDPNRLSYNINLQELSTSYNNLKRLTRGVALPPGLAEFGQVQLSGQFQGNLNAVNGQNIVLQTESYTGFQGDLTARNITDINKLNYQVKIRELRTQAADLKGFVAGGLPPQVQNLGRIRYVGNLSGNLTDFLVEGNLQTDAGSATTDLFIDFNKNYNNASYSGEVDLQNFNLRQVMGDTTFGNVSLAIAVKGSGLTPKDLVAELEGVITAFDYNNYEYNNVRVDGRVERQQFTGEASIRDPNINFAFNGNVNLNDSLPVFNFVADIDTINLNQLNFYPTPLGISANITADFIGLNLDDLDGTLRIADLAIANDTASYQTDSIILRSSEPDTTGKLLTLRSDFINAQVSGDYNLADLPKIIQNFVNDYFPVDQLISPVDQPTELAIEPERVIPDQDFEGLIELNNPVPLFSLFIAGLQKLDTASISMRLDTKGRDLEIQAYIPQLIFSNNAYNNIRLLSQGTPEELTTTLTLEDMVYGTNNIALAELNLVLGSDSLVIKVNAEEQRGDSTLTKLALGGNASMINNTYRFVFEENFILNGGTWRIPADNEILYRSNFLDINNFALRKGDQSIVIASADSPRDVDFAPIEVRFENFQIKEIFSLLNQSDDIYAGEVNGLVTLRDYRTNLNYLVDLTIHDIALNDQPVGNLRIQAEPAGAQIIRINVGLEGQQSNATLAGTYAINTQRFDIEANLRSLELRLLDPFAEAFIEDSEGTLSGNFTVRGTTTDPDLNGTLRFNNISTIFKLSGVRYTIADETVRITNEAINLDDIRLTDDSNNRATLSGSVNYADFNNIGLNLNFNTNRFQLLNTEPSTDALYYGKLFVSANVQIRGSATQPDIQVRASTLDSSQLFVQPLATQDAVASQEDYIIFANPVTFQAEDTTRSLDAAYQLNRAGIDLTLYLNVTDRTELQIIIDPATGDKLVCRGNADLNIAMNPAGDVDITGNYQITRGSYSLNYQGVLKREFGIRPGSRLDFIGDPLDTRFDVAATYTTRTPTFELVRNQVTALTPEQEAAAKTRSPVTVVLSMRGDLEQPVISFDIQIADDTESDPVTGVTAQALARLRDNPTDLNTQVFSLLLFNSFLSQESGGGSLAETGTSVYLSSVSSLLTNQLNRLASQLIKGVNIEVGVESYQSEYDIANAGNTITESQLGVSKQLFNDRLSVQVGGNVNVNSENSLLVQGANFSALAGNFTLEYKLTETGTYRLRVFRRDNYDVLNQTNIPQTGVGISFQKSFGGVKKSKERGKSKRNKNADDKSNQDGVLPDNNEPRIQQDNR
ncbi:MAG: translocation/assembly module TamB domain-containing protein [Saprospiraceae bacterium]